MDFRCEACSKVTTIPDEKVPSGKTFSFNCPQCKEKVIVGAEFTMPEKKEAPKVVEDALAASPDDDDIEYFTEDDKVVLICDKANQEKIKKIYEDLGYKVSIPKGIVDAIKKLKFYTYEMIVLNQEFDKTPEHGYTLHSYLANLTMSIRRKIYVVRVGKEYRTGDNMKAFSESVNLVFNEGELDTFSTVMERNLNDHTRFYNTFVETLKSKGKY